MKNTKFSPVELTGNAASDYPAPAPQGEPGYDHTSNQNKEYSMNILKVWQNHRQWLAKPILRKY